MIGRQTDEFDEHVLDFKRYFFTDVLLTCNNSLVCLVDDLLLLYYVKRKFGLLNALQLSPKVSQTDASEIHFFETMILYKLVQQDQALYTSPQFIVLYLWLLSMDFSSVPGPNQSAASFETSEESSRSIHTKTKLNQKSNIPKDNFILNVQISLFK